MSNSNLKIGIIGVGMVGDPIRRWLEEKQGRVRSQSLFCYDADPKKGYFDAINMADVIFVSVPTPPNPDGSCNVSIVDNALAMVKGNKIVVIKSTIPPGTTEMFQAKYSHLRILFNPEFLTESQAWEDFLHPTRQIVGFTEKSKGDSMMVLGLLPQGNFSSPWASDYNRVELNATEAEFVKYFSNIFGAMKVTLANIVYDLCVEQSEQSGKAVNYENIRTALGADPRVGPAWLNVHHGSYRGYGGFCFPKDLNAFFCYAQDLFSKSRVYSFLLAYGKELFNTIRHYNRKLLESQGLSEEDVSRHDREITLDKKKKTEYNS